MFAGRCDPTSSTELPFRLRTASLIRTCAVALTFVVVMEAVYGALVVSANVPTEVLSSDITGTNASGFPFASAPDAVIVAEVRIGSGCAGVVLAVKVIGAGDGVAETDDGNE